MKNIANILKNENLKPKELALLLLTDLHENHKTGKHVLSDKDKAVLMERVKNFESREDCIEYNKYTSAYFEGAHVNVDVYTCDREVIRLIECLRWLIFLYVENRIVVNFVNDDRISTHAKLLSKYVIKCITFYAKELKKVYSGLLAYKKILDKKAEYVGLDINYQVDKAIKRLTEGVEEFNNHIKNLPIKDDLYIDLKDVVFDEKLYEGTVKFLDTIEQFKTA